MDGQLVEEIQDWEQSAEHEFYEPDDATALPAEMLESSTLPYKPPPAASPRQRKVGRGASKKKGPRNPSEGLKKSSLKKSKEMDMPPTPLGCEWRETEGGWNLFRCWSERDEVLGGKYKKDRYAGFLSRAAWQVMKQYDYETFISVIGQKFRRHGGH